MLPSSGRYLARFHQQHHQFLVLAKKSSFPRYPTIDSAKINQIAEEDIRNIRDMYRLAVSNFEHSSLSYGHSTTSAIEDATFLLLEGLRLPVDTGLEAWSDSSLSRDEKIFLLGLIHRRINYREPVAYLLGATYQQGERFVVNKSTLIPRSFIGEILFSWEEGPEVKSVLDLCTGAGSLAVLATKAFPSLHRVDACDISEGAVEMALLNVRNRGLEDMVQVLCGDLFSPVKGKLYDLIICNPPYVDAKGMSSLPDEYRHEPSLALDGGPDGMNLIRRVLREAPEYLSDNGGLLLEIGRCRAQLELEFPVLATRCSWLETENMEAPGEVLFVKREDLLLGVVQKP